MEGYRPKTYFDAGRTVEWGKDLSQEVVAAMDAGEIFTLLDASGRPHARLLKDSYGTLRQGAIVDETGLAGRLLGLPPSPFAGAE
jgi:hypothetical protein